MSDGRELTTYLGSSPIWSNGIKAALDGRPVIYLGTRLRVARALEANGAKVVAAVHVTLVDDPPEVATFPLRALTVDTRSRTELQIPLFTDVLESHAAEVRAFLDEHDPTQQAPVLCPLSVPRVTIGERTPFTAEAGLAGALETKVAGHGSLEGVLPWVKSEAVPGRIDGRWWSDVTALAGKLGTHRAGRGPQQWR